MATLIYEPDVSGHHLEYLHHYYEGALARPQEQYVFLVTHKFKDVKANYEWKCANNISIIYIDKKYNSFFAATNPYILGWKTSKVLRKYVKEIHPNRIILTMLMQFIPFICWLLPSNVRVRGIMYKIYLYEKEKMSKIHLLAERLRFWIAAHSKVIESIFVLNDKDCSIEFNLIYKTNKFKFIPDPIPDVDISKCRNLREDLSIPNSNKIFLHFGGLDKRKGTLDILYAIKTASDEELECKTFIFAGKIKQSLQSEFNKLYEGVKDKTQIIVFNEFCSYELLYNLCYTCDAILMPYHISSLSSGIIGYASVFSKPVVGPNAGLIGRLINTYNLGYTINCKTPGSLIKSLNFQYGKIESEYTRVNQKQNFINTIMQ